VNIAFTINAPPTIYDIVDPAPITDVSVGVQVYQIPDNITGSSSGKFFFYSQWQNSKWCRSWSAESLSFPRRIVGMLSACPRVPNKEGDFIKRLDPKLIRVLWKTNFLPKSTWLSKIFTMLSLHPTGKRNIRCMKWWVLSPTNRLISRMAHGLPHGEWHLGSGLH